MLLTTHDHLRDSLSRN